MYKKIILALLALSLCVPYTKGQSPSKLKLEFNTNVELLGFFYFLAFESIDIEKDSLYIDGKNISKKDWHPFGYAFSQEYQEFRTSPHLQKMIEQANHLWLDEIINLLLRVEDAPNAKLPEDINLYHYLGFSPQKDSLEALRRVTIFLEAFNQMYLEVDFEHFLSEKAAYYEKAQKEVEDYLQANPFLEPMEAFFQKSYKSYQLIPSLTLPVGMGFAIQKNQEEVVSVFSPPGYQQISTPEKSKMGFHRAEGNQQIIIHEFTHSFVSPIVSRLPDSLFQETKALFEPIREVVYSQGYNTWKATVDELFVRTSELIIAERYNSSLELDNLKKEYIEKRQFVYIPIVLPILKTYSDRGITLEQAIIEGMEKLKGGK